MMGLHLALHDSVEHNRLRWPGFELQIVCSSDARGRGCLIYTEDALQKTSQGGLKCKPPSKVFYVYQASDRKRGPVSIFKKYVGLLPPGKSCKKLYLRVKLKPTSKVWYSDQPFGVNKVFHSEGFVCLGRY